MIKRQGPGTGRGVGGGEGGHEGGGGEGEMGRGQRVGRD